MLAERAAAEALSERRAMRRDRRGGGRANEARVGRRGAKKSIMETTREVERMKQAGESAVAREFVVQRAMSDSVSGEGWFMLETPEYREEQAREAIDLLNGTRLTRGQDDVVVWVPRVPNEEFYVKEEDAEGKSDLELCQMVDEENMLEMLQPGYVLVRCTLTQELMDAFDEMRCVRGFATGGSSRFGKKKYEKLNQPLTMDDQIPRMIAKCVPTVKTQADVERDEARAQARDVVAEGTRNLVEDFADAGTCVRHPRVRRASTIPSASKCTPVRSKDSRASSSPETTTDPSRRRSLFLVETPMSRSRRMNSRVFDFLTTTALSYEHARLLYRSLIV